MLVWLYDGIEVIKAGATVEIEMTGLDAEGTTVAAAASKVLMR
jgi:hypothetical protein